MKTLSYVGISPTAGEQCENLVLMCMDFRFHKRMLDTLGFAGYREFDVLALPGSSKSVRDEQSQALVLDSIALAISIHGVKRVLIVDHIDCRAYGGSESFADKEDELHRHEEALREASRIVRARFPELEVDTLYVGWDYIYQVE